MLKRKLMNMMRSAGRARHQRGSAVLLVIVSLVLMVVLGAVYLQTARVQRFPQTQQGDLDAVIAAIIAQIQTTLKDDITNGEELYDYPWTDQTVTGVWDAELFDGTTAPAGGNQQDDVWLAATSPDFSTLPAAPVWQHITNLNGLYLDYDSSTNAFTENGTTGIPNEHLVDFTADAALQRFQDTNIDLDKPQLFDADGDGIVDSRWTWAPIKQINGVTYVMAARIIDLSSLVNANTALSLGEQQAGPVFQMDTSAAGADAPKWHYPSELDLGRWNYGFSGPASDILSMLDHRTGTTLVSDGVPFATRKSFWENTGRFYRWAGATPTTGNLYKYEDEFELRWRNGLNNSGKTTPVEAGTTGLPTVLDNAWAPTLGLLPHSTATDWNNIQQHFENQPRPQLTTMSGAAMFNWPLTGGNLSTLSGRWHKLDLNVDSAADISAVIADVYNAGGPAAIPNGLTETEFGDQFAANIVDYSDTDNELTQVNGRYGMEYLPFLTEVYSQAVYDGTAVTVGPDWDVTWTRRANNLTGYAIEIRNPFNVDVNLTTVALYIGGVEVGMLSDLAGVPGTPKDWLLPDEVLIFYRDSNNATNAEDSIGADAPAGLVTQEAGFSYVIKPLTFDWPGGGPVVGLHPTVTGSGVANWPYSAIPTAAHPDDVNELVPTATSPGDPTGTQPQAYGQSWGIGNGEKLNIITTQVTSSTLRSPQYSGGVGIRDTAGDNVGEEGKPTAGKIADLTTTQLILRNDRIAHVGELTHIAAIGPSPTQTVAEDWGTATMVSEFMLNFTANLIGADNLAVPHAMALIDRFTTISPLRDGVDNDGDGTSDNDGEYIIPGLVNLNTATRPILENLLSIPNAARRTQVVDAIINYRENPTRAAGAFKGIAFTGELFSALSASPPSYGGDSADNSTGVDNGNVRIDFLANPTSTTPDGIIDDREEEAMIATWLSQVGSTRSDFYAAYVVVRGYKMDEFDAPGVLEAAQFIAIFKRDAKSGEVTVQTVGTAPFMVN